MIKKALSISICAFTLLFTATPVYAEENAVEDTAEQIVEELDGEIISPEDVPEGVTPIEFDSVEEAREFIEASEEALDNAELKVESANSVKYGYGLLAANSNTVTKKARYNLNGLGIQFINIMATCSVKSNTFLSVSSVTSSYTGVTQGSEWTQDTYSSSISPNRKRLDVTVYGHMDYYLVVKSTYTKIGSTNHELPVAWTYQ